MPTRITALAVSKSFNGRTVLDAVTCSLGAGERTGIIGENGTVANMANWQRFSSHAAVTMPMLGASEPCTAPG